MYAFSVPTRGTAILCTFAPYSRQCLHRAAVLNTGDTMMLFHGCWFRAGPWDCPAHLSEPGHLRVKERRGHDSTPAVFLVSSEKPPAAGPTMAAILPRNNMRLKYLMVYSPFKKKCLPAQFRDKKSQRHIIM